jgi:hypothetical protein
MAKVTIETNDGTVTGIVYITNEQGPWTDGGDIIESIAWDIDQALKLEGDEA